METPLGTAGAGVGTVTTENNTGLTGDTTGTDNTVGANGTAPAQNNAGNAPFKTFATQEEFDRHSLGIMESAKKKIEKELLASLGLNPNEKDKLGKIKELYQNSLTEAEKTQNTIKELTESNENLTRQVAEKDAIITALCKVTGKDTSDVSKLVRMAKGLVTNDFTIEQALEEVIGLMKPKQTVTPVGTPPPSVNAGTEDNPFKTGNMTEQGKLVRSDIEKARTMYFSAYGKHPTW